MDVLFYFVLSAAVVAGGLALFRWARAEDEKAARKVAGLEDIDDTINRAFKAFDE